MDYFSIDEAARKLSVSSAVLLDRIRHQEISAHIELRAGTKAIRRSALPYAMGFIPVQESISNALTNENCRNDTLGETFERWHLFPMHGGGEFIDNLYLAARGEEANAKRPHSLGIFVGSWDAVNCEWTVYQLAEQINDSFVPAEKMPSGAQLRISEEEIFSFLNKQRAGPATDARTPAEEGAREGVIPSDAGQAPKPWKMRVQAEAYRYWLQLRAAGANPTVTSIRPHLVTWCKEQNVVTDRKINPSDGYLRTHVLSGSHWNPPETMTPDKAKQLLEQTAQTAQSAAALNVQSIG